MIVFLDDILNGNIAEILGPDLYAETVSKICVWFAVLPMAGLVLAFALLVVSLFGGRRS